MHPIGHAASIERRDFYIIHCPRLAMLSCSLTVLSTVRTSPGYIELIPDRLQHIADLTWICWVDPWLFSVQCGRCQRWRSPRPPAHHHHCSARRSWAWGRRDCSGWPWWSASPAGGQPRRFSPSSPGGLRLADRCRRGSSWQDASYQSWAHVTTVATIWQCFN